MSTAEKTVDIIMNYFKELEVARVKSTIHVQLVHHLGNDITGIVEYYLLEAALEARKMKYIRSLHIVRFGWHTDWYLFGRLVFNFFNIPNGGRHQNWMYGYFERFINESEVVEWQDARTGVPIYWVNPSDHPSSQEQIQQLGIDILTP